MQVVYHSMPLDCFTDAAYQKEFVARLSKLSEGDHTILHLIDCEQTNKFEFNRKTSISSAAVLNSMTPNLVSVPQLDTFAQMSKTRDELRNELDARLARSSRVFFDYPMIEQSVRFDVLQSPDAAE